MIIVLYLVLGVIILVIGFFVWFFLFFLKVSKPDITANLPESERMKRMDEWFKQLQSDNKFNGAVLFAQNGRVLLAKGYGYSPSKEITELTKNSMFRLASVSKQFTAAGIMLLKERGKVNYKDLISVYIKDFPYQEVTIRNLLNHTSGVPDIYMKLAVKNKDTIDLLTNEIAVNLLIKEKVASKFAPTSKFQYSNTNYILLARIIEIVSGLSFEEFMKEELFKPLGMESTRVWNLKSAETTFENKAADFKKVKGTMSELKPTFIDGVAGDGAVFSSVLDLLKWDQFWYENELIDKENLREAFKQPILKNGKKSDYGFGWIITENGMWHNGGWLGANTIIVRNEKDKTCTVLLDNSSNIFFHRVAKTIEGLNHEIYGK